MAIVTFIHPVDSIQGEIAHHSGFVFRKKHAHDEHGEVIHEGKQECYKIVHPRDFKKTPPQGREKEHFDLWKEACRRAKEEKNPEHPRYTYWRERWKAQLKEPDAECPINARSKQKRSYYQFDCFVRVAILWELRQQQPQRK